MPKDKATFRERLRASAENVGTPFTDLIVGPLDEWLTDVVQARNDLAHHGAYFRLRGTAGEHLLAEHVYWLFAMNLLREAGAVDAAFESIGGTETSDGSSTRRAHVAPPSDWPRVSARRRLISTRRPKPGD